MNIDKIDLDERIKYFENHLDEAQIIMTASLEQFIKTFHYIRKNEKFQIKDFHLQVIAELEDLVFGQQKNLLIEMPPRAGKSEMLDYFICWTYIINPNCNYIVTCYNDDLVGKFSKTMKSIIESDLYQKVFKLRMSSDTHSVGLWKIKDGGELRAISINGGITGFGAGIKGERYGGALCIDDALKAVDAKSEVKRKSVIDAYTNTLKSRLNNLDLTPTIVTMQRLHKQDLAGYLENEIKEGRLKNWKIIKVKAIKEDGTSFWEESYSLKSLEDMRVQHPYTFYSQYQQEPINESTSKFKDTMFEEVGIPEEFDYLYIIADTTYKDGQDNDYTVFSCFGVKDKKLYLIDIIRQKIQAVDIEKWCIPFIKKNTQYGFEGCYIEPKGHGIYLNQSLPKQNIMMPSEDEIAEFFKDRKVGKVERANAIMPFFTNNKLYINRDIEKGMKNDIIGECISFPDGEHDDVCLAGNTLISTIKGKIPIKDIKIGDWLITPLGLSKVERCGKTGHKYIIKKYGIEATENHKIFDKYLGKFREIKYDVLVDNISYGGLIKWKYQKLLYLMENGMLLWGRKGIISTHQQRIEAESVLKDFIRQFGNFIIEKKFLKGMLFITKMATLLTTTSLIWSVYQLSNIIKYIKNNLLKEVVVKKTWKDYQKLENLRSNGIEAKKEKNGIVKMQKDILKKYQKKSSAQIAEGDLEKCLQTKQINTEIQSAKNVTTNITKEKKEEKIDVYNITTKAGCYYANDILVSNCDTIIDGVKKYLLKEMINDEDGW